MDFDKLQRPSSPNTWLLAPGGYDDLEADVPAPVFGVPADDLAAAWRSVIAAKPRVTVTAVSSDGLQIEAEQRSAVFGFVDDISFRALPQGDGRSSFIAYSRSRIGYWDIGANRKRLTDWVASLQRQLAGMGKH